MSSGNNGENLASPELEHRGKTITSLVSAMERQSSKLSESKDEINFLKDTIEKINVDNKINLDKALKNYKDRAEQLLKENLQLRHNERQTSKDLYWYRDWNGLFPFSLRSKIINKIASVFHFINYNIYLLVEIACCIMMGGILGYIAVGSSEAGHILDWVAIHANQINYFDSVYVVIILVLCNIWYILRSSKD